MSIFGPGTGRQNFMRLASELGTRISSSDNTFSVACAGQNLVATFSEHKGNVTFKLRCPDVKVPDAILRKENAVDRFGRQLGFGYEPQTGDRLFDDNTFVACRRGDTSIGRLCAAAGVRKGALFLLQAGFDSVDFSSEGIVIQRHYGRNFNITTTQMKELITAYEMILSGLPAFSTAEMQRGHWRPMTIACTLTIAIIVLGIINLIVSSQLYTPLDWSPHGMGFLGGLVLWFVAIFLGARWLRGKIDAFRAWLTGGGLALIGMPLFSISLVVLLNGLLDTSPAVSHNAQVISTSSSSSGKSGRKYYAHVKSWRPGETELKINVSRSTYDSLSYSSSRLVIVTKQGAFGHEWIVSP